MKRQTAFMCAALFIMPVPSFGETVTCAECGMKSDPASKYSARIQFGDETGYFCDIGDLFVYISEKNPSNARFAVRDYLSGEWTGAQTAFYVCSEEKFETPMGWSIAAFRNRADAEAYGNVMDYESARRTIECEN